MHGRGRLNWQCHCTLRRQRRGRLHQRRVVGCRGLRNARRDSILLRIRCGWRTLLVSLRLYRLRWCALVGLHLALARLTLARLALNGLVLIGLTLIGWVLICGVIVASGGLHLSAIGA